MSKDNKEYVVWVLEMVQCLTTLTNKQQQVCCRQVLAQDGPTHFLAYTQILNEGANTGLIKETKARKLFDTMSSVYFEQYDCVA